MTGTDRAQEPAHPARRRLVRRGLARSREQAAELIAAGRVTCRRGRRQGGHPGRPGTPRSPWPRRRDDPDYVSRGGYKLAGALAAFPDLSVAGRRCLDAGHPPAASPTCCCAPAPRRSSRPTSATASWPGRCAPTPRVRVLDRTNVRVADGRRRSAGRWTSWSRTCRSSRCAGAAGTGRRAPTRTRIWS